MNETREFFTNVVLVATATTLFYAAMTDLREFKIRNTLVVALAGLYVAYALLSGQWVYAYWNVALAAVMFVVMLFFYGQNWLGGGDVKILTVGFLWVGIRYAMPFSLLLLVFAVTHIVMAEKFAWVNVKRVEGRAKIPFAPSVAAALIGIFVLRWSGV
jgi:Flp pilus assembly protein protease CpaA